MHTRRELLQTGIVGGLTTSVVSTVGAADARRKPTLRVAHITDVHITNDRESPRGVAALFTHMFGQANWSPDLILNTGDTVMAIDGRVSGARAAEQIALWRTAISTIKVPIRSCLGNHDIWDGHAPSEVIPERKKRFALMTEVLAMPAPYYSFDQGGWHFISLNSVCNWPSYGELSSEHFDWLKADLQKTPKATPICVMSHLPIVSVTSSLYGRVQKKPDGVLIPKVWQHRDCWEISELFRRHQNVKLCLSGHMHTQDRCEYRGVWYICGGAASGAWWNGAEYGFPPCYGTIDLHEDGGFEYRFIDYGWSAKTWRGEELKLT